MIKYEPLEASRESGSTLKCLVTEPSLRTRPSLFKDLTLPFRDALACALIASSEVFGERGSERMDLNGAVRTGVGPWGLLVSIAAGAMLGGLA